MHSLNLLWLASHKNCWREWDRGVQSPLALFNCFRMWVLQIQTFAQYVFQIIHINGTGIHNLLYIQPSLQKLDIPRTTKKNLTHFNLWKRKGEWRESNKTRIICATRKGGKWGKQIVKWLSKQLFCSAKSRSPIIFLLWHIHLPPEVKTYFWLLSLLICCWCPHHFLSLLVAPVFCL